MGTDCAIWGFSDYSTYLEINCTIPTNSNYHNYAIGTAGSHYPKVHFAGLGFAEVDTLSPVRTALITPAKNCETSMHEILG